MTLLPGVPPFSKQLLAASVCVCVREGGTYILATVLSGEGPPARDCTLGSFSWQEVRSALYPS